MRFAAPIIRPVALLAIIGSLILGLLGPPGSPASRAAAQCNPGRANNWNGLSWKAGSYRWDPISVTGVYAQVQEYIPYVYNRNTINPPTSFISSWVMLNNTNDYRKYAQVGWIQFPANNVPGYSDPRYVFRESNNGNVLATQVRYAKSQLTIPYYTVLYNYAGTGWMTYQVSGQTLFSGSLPINPNQGFIASETHTKADQMPGGTSARMQFFDAHLYIGGWQDFAGYGYTDDNNEYGLNGLNTRDFQVWDKKCTF